MPVSTVPCPLIGKQWSIAKWSGPSAFRCGTEICAFSVATKVSRPSDSPPAAAASASAAAAASASLMAVAASASAPPDARSPSAPLGAGVPPGRAATGMIGASANLVAASVLRMRALIFAIASSLESGGSRSSLFSTTMSVCRW